MKTLKKINEFPQPFRGRFRLDHLFSWSGAGKTRRSIFLGVIMLIGVFQFPLSSRADADEGDKGEIAQVMRELAQAYNQKHPELLQNLFTETADVVTLPGQTPVQGPEQVTNRLMRSRSQDFLNGKMEIQIQNIKFFDKDWALVEAKNILQGVATPRGAKLPPIEHPMLFLMEKKKKQWRIESLRYFSRFPILRPISR